MKFTRYVTHRTEEAMKTGGGEGGGSKVSENTTTFTMFQQFLNCNVNPMIV